MNLYETKPKMKRHHLELLNCIKNDVDLIVRQINIQNCLIKRMGRFKCRLKLAITNTDQSQLLLQSEYSQFDRDYRCFRRKCSKMNRRLIQTNVYDRLSDLFEFVVNDFETEEEEEEQVNYDDHSAIDNSNELLNDDYNLASKVTEIVETGNNLFGFISDNLVCQLEEPDPQSPIVNDSGQIVGQDSLQLESFGCDFAESTSDQPKLVLNQNCNNSRYRCDFPGCHFSSHLRYNLNRHKQCHNLELLHCDQPGCRYVTKSSYNLDRHRTKHSQIKQCKKSDRLSKKKKKSLTKQKQQQQQQINKERKFKCDFSGCLFSANQRYNLNRHKMTHNLNPNYSCQIGGCSYTTNSIYNLSRHQRLKCLKNQDDDLQKK